jgi:hypothetical protein
MFGMHEIIISISDDTDDIKIIEGAVDRAISEFDAALSRSGGPLLKVEKAIIKSFVISNLMKVKNSEVPPSTKSASA